MWDDKNHHNYRRKTENQKGATFKGMLSKFTIKFHEIYVNDTFSGAIYSKYAY